MTSTAVGLTDMPLDDASTGRSKDKAALLTVSDLRHSFDGRSVLDGLSFSVGKGELFALLGPNGCGKSTTLRVLSGLLVPDQGQLTFQGQAIEPGGRALREHMGVVFQSGSLDGRLTARENLMLGCALYGIHGKDAAARTDQVLSLTGLESRAEEPVKNYSGGMRRRLELSRALLHDPSLLLMDEPTTGLDESAFRRTWKRILELREQRGLTVLFSTHRAEEAQLCDRVAIIDGGKVIAMGPPEELRSQVSGDVLTLEADEPEQLAADIAEKFHLAPRVVNGQIVLEHEHGHELIPRLVEGFPRGRITSLSMHRPTLSDVFVKLTGRLLGDEGTPSEDHD